MPIKRLWPLVIAGFLLAVILYTAETWGWIEPTNIRLIGFVFVVLSMTAVDTVLNGLGYEASLLEPTNAPPSVQWLVLIFVLVTLILIIWAFCHVLSLTDKKSQGRELLKIF
ncbi:MAG: hypothetical protein V1760_00030 [Candidatus Peregrinibacteria bacterium]